MVKFYRILIFALASIFSLQIANAQNTVVTPAPAQTNVCVGSGYVTLGMIIIAETNFANFNAGNNQTYTMSVPANFEFNSGSSPIITANGGGVSGINIQSFTATTLTFQYNVSGGSTGSGPLDSIRITGLQVRAVNAASTGSIARSGGSAVMAGNASSDGQVHCSLTSVQDPNITSQPSPQSVCVNDDPTFSVTATGTGLSYQWRRYNVGSNSWGNPPGGSYSGQTTATLTINNASSTQDGFLFACLVTGACGIYSSDTVLLSVGNAASISTQPSNQTVCSGNNTSFTVSASNATGYQWQVDQGSGFNNVSGGVYSGATSGTLNITGATTGMNGYTYKCIVYGSCNNVTSSTRTLTVNSTPTVNTHPGNQSTCAGGNTSFTVSASGATGYQWQVDQGSGFGNVTNGGVYGGATTSTLSITSATLTMNNYQYRCVVSNSCGSVNSNGATLTVNNSAPATFFGLDTKYCRNGIVDTLEAFPVGGTFSGTGIGATNVATGKAPLDPKIGGTGSRTITYTYGCTVVNKSTTVYDTTNIAYTSPVGSPVYAVSDPSTDLVVEQVPPAGPLPGTFSGTGVYNSKFYPNLAGPGGPFPVKFVYTDANGCNSQTSINISVTDNSGTPIPPLTTGPYCPGSSPIQLYDTSLTTDPIFINGLYEFAGYDGSPDLVANADGSYTFNPATPGTYVINYKIRALTFSGGFPFFTFVWDYRVHASQTVTVSSSTSPDFTLPSSACNTESAINMNPFPGIASGGPGTGFSIISPASYPPGLLTGVGNSTFNPNVVLTQTTFKVRYTYYNASGCSGFIDKQITVTPKPDIPTLYPGYGLQYEEFCYNSSRKLLVGDFTLGGSFAWYKDPSLAPAYLLSSNYVLSPQYATDFNPNTYNYYLTRTVGGCVSDPLVVTVKINDQATVNPGTDFTICEGGIASLTGTSMLLVGGSNLPATWSSTTGGTFDNANSLTAQYTPSTTDITNGYINLSLTSNDPDGAGPCPVNAKTVHVNINRAATINAGNDTTYCSSSVINLSGNKGGTADGVVWSGGLGSFVTPSAIGTVYNPDLSEKLGSTVTFTLTAADPDDAGPCTSVSDQVNVTINQEVVVNGGANQTICEGNTATLNGASNLLVSGLTIPATWSTATGGTFDNANNLNAIYTPSASDIGNSFVDLTLTSNDPDNAGPCPVRSATTRVIINPSASAYAGSDTTYCSSKDIFLQGSFGGSAQSITWTGGTLGAIQSPTSVITRYNATTTEKSGQVITFTLTTNDPDGGGPCSAASDQVNVTINQEASSDAGTDQSICRSTGTTVFNLNGLTKYKHDNSPLGGTWTGGLGTFSNPTSLTATYTPHSSEIPADGMLSNTVKLFLTSDDPDAATSGPCPVIKDSVLLKINPLPRIDSVKVIDTLFCTSDNAFQMTVVMQSQYPKFTETFTDLPVPNQGVTGTFFAPQIANIGPHTLRYTFTDINGCSNYKDTLIHVYGVPRPKITIANYCATRATNFDGTLSDISFDTESSINYYKWNFGDFLTEDDTARTVTSSYVYNKTLNAAAKQSYTIKLQVGTDKGCFGQKDSTITIGNIPATDYSWSGICPTDVTAFIDLSSFPSNEVSQYIWDFGDGSAILSGPGMLLPGPTANIALKNPSHQMANGTGPYNVSYTISSVRGCDSTITHRVDILDQYRPTPSDPYATNFATDNAFWAVDGKKSSWQWGPSVKPIINTAGRRVWVTDTLDSYNANEDSHLNGPCLNMQDLLKPMISLKINSATQNQFAGAVLQASTDGGGTWSVVGKLGDGVNWYDNFGVQGSPGGQQINQFGWTGVYGGWKTAKISLNSLAGQTSVRLRLAFGAGADTLNLKDGFALDSVWVGERDKVLLVENFTNTSSITAASNDAALNTLVDIRSNDLVAIHYHTSFPGADPMNNRNPADASSRVLYYSASTVPYKVFEGNYNYGTTLDTGDIDRRSLESAKFKIKMNTEISASDSVTVKAQVYAADSLKNDILVHIAVIERFVTVPGSYQWVLTKMLPDAAGTFFNQDFQKGDSIYVQQAWNFVSGTDVYDPAQLGFIVFVQDATTKEVYQTSYILGSGGSVTGLKHQLLAGKDVFVYPNPANNEVNLVFESSDKEYSYIMYDEFGRVVATGNVEGGQKELNIETSDLAAGLYVVKIGNSEEGWAFKKVVIGH